MSRRYWYLFSGGNDQLPGSYLAPQNLEPTCSTGSIACKVYVSGGATNPTPNAISANIKAYLAFAKVNHLSSYPQTSIPYVGART